MGDLNGRDAPRSRHTDRPGDENDQGQCHFSEHPHVLRVWAHVGPGTPASYELVAVHGGREEDQRDQIRALLRKRRR